MDLYALCYVTYGGEQYRAKVFVKKDCVGRISISRDKLNWIEDFADDGFWSSYLGEFEEETHLANAIISLQDYLSNGYLDPERVIGTWDNPNVICLNC